MEEFPFGWKLNSWTDYCTSLSLFFFFMASFSAVLWNDLQVQEKVRCVILQSCQKNSDGVLVFLSTLFLKARVSQMAGRVVQCLPSTSQVKHWPWPFSSPFLRASRPEHENNVGLKPPAFPSARHQQEWEEFQVIRERKIMFCGLAEWLKILWSPNGLQVVLYLGGNAVCRTFLSP